MHNQDVNSVSARAPPASCSGTVFRVVRKWMWPSNPHFLSGPLTLARPSIRILGEESKFLVVAVINAPMGDCRRPIHPSASLARFPSPRRRQPVPRAPKDGRGSVRTPARRRRTDAVKASRRGRLSDDRHQQTCGCPCLSTSNLPMPRSTKKKDCHVNTRGQDSAWPVALSSEHADARPMPRA